MQLGLCVSTRRADNTIHSDLLSDELGDGDGFEVFGLHVVDYCGESVEGVLMIEVETDD